MGYTVYIKSEGKWVAWSTEISYVDALIEAEYLTKYEGIETKVD